MSSTQAASFWDDRRVTWTNASQALTWGVLAVILLPRRGHFLLDEARFYDRSLEVLDRLRPAEYGQAISGTADRLVFTPGGGFYDLMAPGFIAGRDPIWGSVWTVILSTLGLILLDRALKRLSMSPLQRLVAVTLATWCIWHARYADRLWNYHALLFAVPLLLWITARTLLAPTPSWRWALAWGAAAALVIQCHPTGLFAIPLCLLAARTLGKAPTPHWQLAATAFGGGVLAYAPYLIAEAQHRFANTRHLLAGRPTEQLLGSGFGRSLVAALKLSSQVEPDQPFAFWPPGFLSLGVLTAAMMLALWWVGLSKAPRTRTLGWATLAMVPLSFVATGRDYFDHYALFAYPFFFIVPAAGLAWLASRSRAWGVLAGLSLAGYVALGVVLLTSEYGSDRGGYTIARQKEIAAHLAAMRAPFRLSVSPLPADEFQIYEILSRRVYGVTPPFSLEGTLCSLDPADTIDAAKRSFSIDNGWLWLTCPREVLP